MKKTVQRSDEEIAMQKHIGDQLLRLRTASRKSKEFYAELFDVSLSTYKRWESDGPSVFSIHFWLVYNRLSADASIQTKAAHDKDIVSPIGQAFSYVFGLLSK